MGDLVQDILDGTYIPTDEDFMNNPNLCANVYAIQAVIKYNPSFIKYFRFLQSHVPQNEIEKTYQMAIDSGYIPVKEDFNGSNQMYEIPSIMEAAIIHDPETVAFNIKYLDFALLHGLVVDETFLHKYPRLLGYNRILKMAIDINPSYIDMVNYVSPENLKYAISKGYMPTEKFIKKLYSSELMKICIDVDPSFIQSYKKNSDNELEIDEDLIRYAISKGYVPTREKIAESIYLSRSEVITNYLLNHDNEIMNNRFLQDYRSRSSIKGLNFEIITSIWPFIGNNSVYDAFDYNEILKIVKYVYCGFERRYDLARRYIPEYTFPQLKQSLEQIVSSGRVKQFGDVLRLVADGYSFKDKLNIINLISNHFLEHSSLIDHFLSSDINPKRVYLLKHLLLSEEDNSDVITMEDLEKYNLKIFRQRTSLIDQIEFSSEEFYDGMKLPSISRSEELCIPDGLYFRLPNEFKDSNASILLMKNIILKMMCNMSYSQYFSEVFNGFSSSDINNLIHNTNDSDVIEELQNYRAVVEFIEAILKCRDFRVLKKMAININNSIYRNGEAIIPIYEILGQFPTIKREFYGQEIRESITTISEIKPNHDELVKYGEGDKYIRENNKYAASSKQIYGRDISGKQVDYIELDGLDFVVFIHTMNAYGDGGTLEDFNYSRLMGKSYICLSAISDYNRGRPEDRIDKDFDYDEDDYTDSYDEEKLDYVTLAFDNLKKEQLIFMAPYDIGSDGSTNSLDVTSDHTSIFLPVRDLIKEIDDESYSEYVFYREDDEGNTIYPSGVLIRDYPPTQYEIDAAAYLNVPLIYINEDFYKRNDRNTIQEEKDDESIDALNNAMRSNELNEMLAQLKGSVLEGIKERKR